MSLMLQHIRWRHTLKEHGYLLVARFIGAKSRSYYCNLLLLRAGLLTSLSIGTERQYAQLGRPEAASDGSNRRFGCNVTTRSWHHRGNIKRMENIILDKLCLDIISNHTAETSQPCAHLPRSRDLL